jgi:imidazoleglycerol-phosphate dehydratase
MLTHIAVHGLFDLTIKATGDLHIDVHHTVEDVALALGSAFDQALGDRKGIVRMASFYAPMDETLAFVVLDLSGRPYAVIDAEWGAAPVGQIPTSLFPKRSSKPWPARWTPPPESTHAAAASPARRAH